MLFASFLGKGHGPGRWEKAEGTERIQLGVSREGASEIAGATADPTLRSTNQKWVNLSLKRVSRVYVMRHSIYLRNCKDRGIRYL